MPSHFRFPLLATLLAASLESGDAGAQGGIACLPMMRGPDYSFEKVLDVAEAYPLALLPNDRGHALLVADPAGTDGRCLLRHRGATTEPVVCTRNIDDESPFTSIQEAHWNEGGTIVLRGSVFGIPGSSQSQIQVIEPNGAVFALSTGTFPQKRDPVISGAGNVFYVQDQAGSGLLQRYVPTLAGNDKSETIPDANGVVGALFRAQPSSVEGKLYFSAPGGVVGSVQNALNSLTGPPPPLPYYTAYTVADAFSNVVATPNRFGALLYYTATEIRKRFDIGGTDFVAGDPEFIIETTAAPGVPIVTSGAALAGPCKVALSGHARGLCTQGPHDGLVCDPDEFPDPCSTGIGGPDDGFCQNDVQGIFVHQAGTYAAIAREGDAMLGSTVQDFFNSVSFFVVGSNAGHIFFPVRLTDGREVIVRADPGTSVSFPALPTSCTGVSCRFGLTPQHWLGVGPNGVPLYFDPDIATGYDYSLDEGDPLFASVIVPEPLPNGDASFTLIVGEASFPLAAGEHFDLTQIDPLGVAAFSIRGIDPGEELDPEDPLAFVTGATFMEEREANVTMTAVVPEPGAMALGAAVLGALATLSRRSFAPR
jgi:hypothetical protein